jgi:SAM-dependent methyltransferase
MIKRKFEELVEEALAQQFSGWDFSWMQGRYFESEPFWNYRQMVQDSMKGISSMLDMGTGGGEFLAGLPDLPEITYATEGYPPNIPIATRRLQPFGVKVVVVEDERNLPLPDAMFDLVINRHEYYDISEIMRILKPGGIFLTQQVGPRNCVELNQYLGAPIDTNVVHWKLDQEIGALEQAGFSVLQSHEQVLESNFFDIGAVVFYLKVIEWQIEGFSVAKYEQRLRDMHELIELQGAFFASEQRFLIEAQKPE